MTPAGRAGRHFGEPAVRRLVDAVLAFQVLRPDVREVRLRLAKDPMGRPMLLVGLVSEFGGSSAPWVLQVAFSALPSEVPRHCKTWVARTLGRELAGLAARALHDGEVTHGAT